jgi:hypothetical protein
MKKLNLIILLLCFVQVLCAQTESLDRLIRKAKRGASEKIDLTLPGFLVRFGANFINEDDLDGVNIRPLLRKINEVRVVTIEGGQQVQKSDIREVIQDLRAENFEELITVRDDGSHINILMRERKGFIRDLLIFVSESSEFVVVDINGKFTMDDINELVRNVEMNGRKVDTKYEKL